MSFATASCDLWQNEQRRDSSRPRVVFNAAAPSHMPAGAGCDTTDFSLHRKACGKDVRKCYRGCRKYPCRGRYGPIGVGCLRAARDAKRSPTPQKRDRGRPRQLRAWAVDDVVDDAVFLGLRGGHDEVAFHVVLDAVERLPGAGTHQLVGDLANAQNFAGMDVDVRGLAAESAHRRLMDEDARVGQRETLALLAGHQQEGTHGSGLPDADRRHIVLDGLHGVEDGEAGSDGASGRIDTELDVFFRVLAGEEKQLRDDQIGDVVVDRRAEEDNVVAEQTAVDVVGAFAPARLLEHHWYKSHRVSLSVAACSGYRWWK